MFKKEGFLKVVLCLCALLVTTSPAARVISGWTQIFEGIEYATGSDTSPRLMRAYAMRIDLWNPDVAMFATPSNGGSPYETNLQTTPSFLDAYNLKAAVNANFFNSYSGSYADNEGLLISNGTVVSNAQSGTFSTQLNFTSEMAATLVGSSSNPSGVYTAVGGAEVVLWNGQIVGTNPDVVPRTVLGLSSDAKYLCMVVIDGRQSGYSLGCNQAEAAQWLLDFGAYCGANFDGGGSSCLVRDNGYGSPTVLNSPSDGSPRAVGANLGVYSCAPEPTGPGSASRHSSSIDVAARGWDNSVMHNYWSSSTGWSGWTSLGGATYDSPAVCSMNSSRVDVFVRSTGNDCYQKYYNSGWSSWVGLGGSLTSAPAAVSWGDNRMDVFAKGSSNQCIHTWYNNGWSGWWEDLGGSLTSAPTACSWASGRLDVFARGGSNHLIHKYYSDGWSSWEDLGGSLTSAPTAVCWGGERIDVFARGGSNHLVHTWYDSNGWAGWWEDLGGSMAGSPSADSRSSGTLDVFYRGTDGDLYQVSYNNGWATYNLGSYY
jgi:hypothetical protein